MTGQVFPEVTRLVTRGDGTHRITLKLNPEALGEVRVVLTLREGEVHVRITGASQAQEALAHGAPELRRLLEATGANATQVVVGESTSATSPGDRSSSESRDGSPTWAGQDGAGQRHTDDRTAGTRDGGTSARDGSTGGTRPRASTDPTAGHGGGARPRFAGVDVTM